jgi:hypothetical protein
MMEKLVNDWQRKSKYSEKTCPNDALSAKILPMNKSSTLPANNKHNSHYLLGLHIDTLKMEVVK